MVIIQMQQQQKDKTKQLTMIRSPLSLSLNLSDFESWIQEFTFTAKSFTLPDFRMISRFAAGIRDTF